VSHNSDILWELEQIKRLKSRYFRLQDLNRWSEWADVFTEDCEVADPIEPEATLRGRNAIAARTEELAAASSRAHRGATPDIELLDERTARGTWALHCIATFSSDAGSSWIAIYGHYTDEYRKDDDGQWRIHRMRYDNDITVPGPLASSSEL
jgi:ketosteroid isomerase-like protein